MLVIIICVEREEAVMKCTKLLPNIQNQLDNLFAVQPLIMPIVHAIEKSGGTAYLVGGAVRDLLLDAFASDIDLEVHALTLEQLEKILSTFGPVSYQGKSFGILRIHNTQLEWALPRTDSAGRKPQVTVDPQLPIEEALRRRDLTINALAINLSTREFIDPFGGYQDLCTRTLRTPDAQFFTQDPLRFFRVMQFLARFQALPDSQLNHVCATMSIEAISRERIEAEFEKLFLKSKKPSLGIRWLLVINRLHEILPEVAALTSIPQEYEWHPEGTVFEHTMQALDAAAAQEYASDQEKLLVMYAALCHDLGKAVTTKFIRGRIRSIGHDSAGAPLARNLLKRITRKHELLDTVPVLVKQHMAPLQFISGGSSLSAYKRLALRLAPHTTLEYLIRLAQADRQGRNYLKGHPLQTEIHQIERFKEQAQKAGVYHGQELPVLRGSDIRDLVPPGPAMGQALKYAYEQQMRRNTQDKVVLKELVRKFLIPKKITKK